MANTPRRTLSARPKPTIPTVDQPEETDWLSSGDGVEKALIDQKSRARPTVREFFFVKAELNSEVDASTGKKKKKGTASAYVHFAVNYADVDYKVAIPRISIKENGNFKAYTSIAGDCAIQQATGQHASLRPVYFLVDHRSYEKDGKEYTDNIKTWMPPSAVMSLVDIAIEDLADSLNIDRSQVDITQYPAKITKSGSGRDSAWSVSFMAREEQCSDDAWDSLCAFFYGKEEAEKNQYDSIPPEVHSAKIRKILAPDPRYMISKGGSYSAPAARPTDDGSEAEVPY